MKSNSGCVSLTLLYLSTLDSWTYLWKWKSLESFPIFCDPMDYTVCEILQARILEWVTFPFSRISSQSRDQTQVFCTEGRFFTSWAPREARTYLCPHDNLLSFHLGNHAWCSSVLRTHPSLPAELVLSLDPPYPFSSSLSALPGFTPCPLWMRVCLSRVQSTCATWSIPVAACWPHHCESIQFSFHCV